ncbi:MAG: sugar transferase [Gammaproteobacteria bacterium]|nr:sugar transferase [Gammaproteobacteria bacterium]MCY4210602.1 sugar transferase [Gammaproteobacteria bacterium]MCY4338960.1 sugar transferase [Gammaproteobacteria bacterium]
MNDSIGVRDGYKRVFDLTVIIFAYMLLFPLWLIVWIFVPLAIWLEDRGPVFYAQERVGRFGQRFKVLKFRTMIQNAESLTGQVWAQADDPRLTRVGRILRRLHLDEIPQVINIIKGEMSLVGPRPERPALAEQFSREVPGFSARLRVRPGIAGLAQVRGSYWTDPEYKLRYDNQYIETMSPWLDLKLLFLAVWVAIKRVFYGADASVADDGAEQDKA